MPSTGAALFLIVVFVLPGFLTVRLAAGRLPVGQPSDTRAIVFAVLFSTIIHLTISPWTLSLSPRFEMIYQQISNVAGAPVLFDMPVMAWLGTLLFALPLVLAEIINMFLRSPALQGLLERYGASAVDLVPQAWDWSFLSDRGGWIVVQLKGGLLLGGQYGDKSFASVSPAKPDIFLEKIYNIDERHRFLDPVPGSAGAWIDGSAIDIVHFYQPIVARG